MSSRSISPYERYGKAFPIEDSAIKKHVWNVTDTLTNLAHKFYNDWRLWRLIADRNSIADARNIAVGTVLIIPRKPLEKGRYEST